MPPAVSTGRWNISGAVEALVPPLSYANGRWGGRDSRGLGNMKHHSGADIMILLAVEVDLGMAELWGRVACSWRAGRV